MQCKLGGVVLQCFSHTWAIPPPPPTIIVSDSVYLISNIIYKIYYNYYISYTC